MRTSTISSARLPARPIALTPGVVVSLPRAVATPTHAAEAQEISGQGLCDRPGGMLSGADKWHYALRDLDILMEDGGQQYTLRVRDMAAADKPRERLQQHGPADLSVADLVAILLATGTRREEVMTMSRRIVREYGERALLRESRPQHLAESLQIPITKATQLVASFELGRRFYETRSGKSIEIRTAAQAWGHLSGMGQLRKEQLRALYLNSRYRLVHEEVVSMGSLTANIVHPREVFQPAIEHGAVAVIVAHNHPSGSLEPTYADTEVTEQLQQGGKLLGIELLDHLIITEHSYKSIGGDAL